MLQLREASGCQVSTCLELFVIEREEGGQREGKGRHKKCPSQRAEESLLVSNRWENKNNKKQCRKSIKATPGGRHG